MQDTLTSTLQQIRNLLGPQGFLTEPQDIGHYVTDIRSQYPGRTTLVARPDSTAQVAAVVKLCAEAGIAVVPQGGHTGLCGGGVPLTGERPNIVLSLNRMNRVRQLDAANFTLTVEAGCILAHVQQAAAEADRLFPLNFGAEGSCTIGGNLSTNAGGQQVLRYGNTRELVLGVEVVLADGQVIHGLRGLRKDNTGYDLKQLFIGAEGTLGVITAATLRLFPKPRITCTALVALPSSQAVIDLFVHVRGNGGELLTAFEFLPRSALDLVARHVGGVPEPFAETHPWYVLMEMSSSAATMPLQSMMEELLGHAIEQGFALDVSIASSIAQSRALWRTREAMFEAGQREGPAGKHDVSVPISAIPAFIDSASRAVVAYLPGARPMGFGHCGDGNVHYNVLAPVGMSAADFKPHIAEINRLVHDAAAEFRGSISAEHGIGYSKRDELPRYKSAVELQTMLRIKRALDPSGLMNPSKVLSPSIEPLIEV